jgi:broad specificity phosphatase PhoE
METTLYLVRHGRPELPDGEMRFVGSTDLPLSREGREQAAALRTAFMPIPLVRVCHSGMLRASETAAVIADGRDILRTEVPELRELSFGEWEMRTLADVAARDPREFAARERNFARFAPPGGESFPDAQRRAMPAFRALSGEEGSILVVAHAGIFKTILFSILGMPWENLFSVMQDYCGVHVIERTGEYLTVRRVNWTPHL